MTPKRLERLPRLAQDGHAVVYVASTWRARLLGLAWLRSIPRGTALLLPSCSSVHTFGMRFELDVLFLDAEGRVIGQRLGMRPRRVAWCRGARAVVEMAAG